MARGGVRPGAGRKKSPEVALIKAMTAAIKKDKLVEKAILPPPSDPLTNLPPDKDLTPLSYLLGIVQDPNKQESDRVRAAALALPFCHAKPGEPGKKGEKEQAAKSASSGKFGTPPPPRLVASK